MKNLIHILNENIRNINIIHIYIQKFNSGILTTYVVISEN